MSAAFLTEMGNIFPSFQSQRAAWPQRHTSIIYDHIFLSLQFNIMMGALTLVLLQLVLAVIGEVSAWTTTLSSPRPQINFRTTQRQHQHSHIHQQHQPTTLFSTTTAATEISSDISSILETLDDKSLPYLHIGARV